MEQVSGIYKNDFRLDPLYEALHEFNISYIEIVHTVLGRKMIRNMFYRKRPVIYLEAIDFFYYFRVIFEKEKLEKIVDALDFNNFSAEEILLVKTLLIKYGSSIIISGARVSFFRKIFTLSAVRQIFAIDDVRTINDIVMAALEENISFFSIQHGHFTKYHVGWLKMTNLPTKNIIPTKTIVWNKYWKEELIRLGTYFTDEKIIIGGDPKELRSQVKEIDNIISILIPYEKNAPKSEVTKYILELIKLQDVKIFFKLRPDEGKQIQLEEYNLLKFSDRITLVRDLETVLPTIDIVLGSYSTFLYDMVALEKPVGIIETSIDYGEGMITNNLAFYIKKDEDVYQQIKKISETSTEVLRQRRQKMVSGGRLLKEALNEILSQNFN